MEELERFKKLLIEQAQALGFTNVRITAAVPAAGFERLKAWLAAGYAGEMDYLAKRLDAYAHPRHVLDGVRSLVMLTTRYSSPSPEPSLNGLPLPAQVPVGTGRVSRYAWGETDYHDVIHERLRQLIRTLQPHFPTARWRGVVDTAPLLEREFAARAGLGWIGKHTLVLDRQEGSWFFLAALLTDLELPHDTPLSQDYCGSCRACLDACPTAAFPEPYVLDAHRCISYLTIEHRSAIPHELRAFMGDWVFGCDVCQEVCPWNRRAPTTSDEQFQPRAELAPLSLPEMFAWDDDQFRRHFRQTPLWRARRRGMLRNAAIVLGNQRAVDAEPALKLGLHDAEPLVRGASAWALGELGTATARELLQQAASHETDAEVLSEIEWALTLTRG